MPNEQKNELTIMEWNLHGMAGSQNYKFPYRFIIEHIKRMGVLDLIVFTEFDSFRFNSEPEMEDDAKKFKDELERMGYEVFYTNLKGRQVKGEDQNWNGVGIAIKKELQPESCISDDYRKMQSGEIKDTENLKKIPDHLIVKCIKDGYEIFVVGTRIRPTSEIKVRRAQFDYLMNELIEDNMKNTIVIGDFNNGRFVSNDLTNEESYNYNVIKKVCEDKKYHLYTPGIKKVWKNNPRREVEELDVCVFSYVMKFKKYNKDCFAKYKLDHLITSFDADLKDYLNDKTRIRYDWKFIGDAYTNLGEYGNDIREFPDHAILYAKVKLDNLKK